MPEGKIERRFPRFRAVGTRGQTVERLSSDVTHEVQVVEQSPLGWRDVGKALGKAITLPSATRDSATLAASAKTISRGLGTESLFGAEAQTMKRDRDFLEAMADRTWVYACVTRKAKSMKQGTLLIEPAKGDGEPLDKHPMLDLFDSPNPSTSGGLFAEQMQMDLDLTGNFYAEVVYGVAAASYPLELYRMQPDKVKILVDRRTGEVDGYLFIPGGVETAVRLEPWQVWHRRYANPLSDYVGLSPLSAARDSIVFEYHAKAQITSYFANGLRFSGLISGPENVAADDLALMRRATEGRYRGSTKAHQVLILPGQWDYTDFAGTPKDSDWIEGQQLSRREVCAIYRVAPPLAGDFSEGTTFSNLAEARDEFWQGTMAEHYSNLDEDLNHSLLPRFGNHAINVKARHDLSEIPAMVDDLDKAYARSVAAYNGGIATLNESRDPLGLEAFKNGDVRRITMAVTEIPADEPPPDPADIVEPAPPVPPPPDPKADPKAPDAEPDPKDAPKGDPPTGQQSAPVGGRIMDDPPWLRNDYIGGTRSHAHSWIAARQARTSKIVAKGHVEIRKAMRAQRDELIRWIETGGGKHSSQPDTTPTTPASDVAGLVAAFHWTQAQSSFQKSVRSVHILAAEQAWTQSAEVGLDVTFSLDSPLVVNRLESLNNRANGIKLITGQQRQDVLDEVAKGMRAGASIDQIVNGGTVEQVDGSEAVELDGIRGVYAPWASAQQSWKAERVARTETGMAYNLSGIDSYRAGGIDKVHVYDGDSDEECADADGQVWTLDEADDNPLEHPNCVRAFGPFTDADDE